MSEEYEKYAKKMEERFPKMYGGQYGGFAIGKGWYPLIEQLSAVIQNHIDNIHKRNEKTCPQVVVEQVKEKFGTLRFYYSGGDDYIRGVTSLAESMTAVTCEECGKPGRMREGRWLVTLCDEHDHERELQKLLKEGMEQ